MPDNLKAGEYTGFVFVINVGGFGMFKFNVTFYIKSITPN